MRSKCKDCGRRQPSVLLVDGLCPLCAYIRELPALIVQEHGFLLREAGTLSYHEVNIDSIDDDALDRLGFLCGSELQDRESRTLREVDNETPSACT